MTKDAPRWHCLSLLFALASLLLTGCTTGLGYSLAETSHQKGYWYCLPKGERRWHCSESKPPLFSKRLEPLAKPDKASQPPVAEVDPAIQPASSTPPTESSPIVEVSSSITLEPTNDTVAAQASAESIRFDKVLQLGAFSRQSQAVKLQQQIGQLVGREPALVKTLVKGRNYFTVVYEQLESQQQAEQLLAQLAQAMPALNPWLRSRTGFEATLAQ